MKPSATRKQKSNIMQQSCAKNGENSGNLQIQKIKWYLKTISVIILNENSSIIAVSFFKFSLAKMPFPSFAFRKSWQQGRKKTAAMRIEAHVGSLGHGVRSVHSPREAAEWTQLGSEGDDSSAQLVARFGSPPVKAITRKTQYRSTEFEQCNRIIAQSQHKTCFL